MNSDVDLSVAVNTIDRRIAKLNMEIIDNKKESLQVELDKLLNIKREIYQGNNEIIQKVINNEI